jgi:hypothetical protein
MKHQKKKKVRPSSLICNILRVGRLVGVLGWDYDKLTSESSK